MHRRSLLVGAPLLLLGGLGAKSLLLPGPTRGEEKRIASEVLHEIQNDVNFPLLAPTWLPRGGRVGMLGARRGTYRVMQDFMDREGQVLCILSQEQRTPERDLYHKGLFEDAAEARAQLGSGTAYLITGHTGERRLFWNAEKTAVILSSFHMSDDEMLRVAEHLR